MKQIVFAFAFAPFTLLAATPAEAQAQAQTDATPPAKDSDIIVTARRLDVARDEQKAAPNLINVQPAEEIAKYPDFNAAEALGRVPGVSLAIDTGEGRFVAIRGIDSNLNGTTFGGVTLLNTQPGGTYFGGGGRAVELDTVPIGSIDRLVVTKTGLPSLEAEGLGGSVELTPRTAAGVTKPFAEATFGGGYEPLRGNGDVFRAEATVGSAFGAQHNLSLVLTASFHGDKRAIDDVEPGFLDDGTVPNTALDSVDLRRYNYHRRRFGFGGELRWDPSATSSYYIRANDAGYTESVNRQILQYRSLGDVLTPDPANAPNGYLAGAAQARETLRDEQETHLNFILAAGGRNDLGQVTIDYQGAYTSATYHRDYDRNSQFRQRGTFTVGYDNITNPGFPRLTPVGFNPNDPNQFTLAQFSNATERAFDREFSGVLNVTVPAGLLGGTGAFKVGGKVRFRDKIDQPYRFNYAVPAGVTLNSVRDGGPYTDFYNGNYSVGVSPSAPLLRTLFANATPTGGLQPGGYFNDTENIYAGYAQYDGRWGKFGLLAGVRVEATDATYRGLTTGTAANPVPTSRTSRYTNVFPTVQLRYDVTPHLLARATWSTGIGRPGFLQLIPGASVDVGNQAVSVGNPNLKPITGNNFDATVEWYLPNSGILSVGFFDKEFENYILQRITRDPNYPGISGITTVSTYSNVGHSYARGIEASYVQKFKGLPQPFDGLGISSNITYVDSRVQIRDALTNNGGDPAGTLPASYSQLPGTSTLTYNVAALYEAHGVQLRLSLLHVDPAIFQVGGADGLDVFEAQRTTLDFTSSFDVSRHVEVYFNAKNLLDTPLRYYEGSTNRTIQREFYDVSYEAGVRLKI